MRAEENRLFWTVLLIGTVMLGCSVPQSIPPAETMARARAALYAERYYEALSLLSTLPPESEKTPEYYYIKGVAAFKLGDFRQAVDALEKAQPQSIRLNAYIVYLYLLLGDAEKAKAVAKELARRYGYTPEISILLGNIRLKEQDYRAAERYFRLALARDPASSKAYIGLANAALLQRRFALAEENYLQALFLSPNDSSPYIALIHFYIALQRYAEAEETAKAALTRFPADYNLLFVLSNVYLKMGNLEAALALLQKIQEELPPSPALLARTIKHYLYLQRLDEAERLIKVYRQNNRDDYQGLLLLGEYYLRKGDLDLALLHLNEALLKNERSSLVHYYLGVVHTLKNNRLLAIQALKQSIKNFPAFPPAHLLLATLYLTQKRYTLASEHARLVLQLDPGNVNAHLLNGIALYLQGALAPAEYEFAVVDHLSPRNPSLPFLWTLLALAQNRPEKARHYLTRIESSSVEHVFLELSLGRLTGMSPAAMEERLAPYGNDTNSLILMLLGNFYQEQGEEARAEVYWTKAREANPASVIPYYSLAALAARQGRRQAAITLLQRAIEINPYFIKAYQALGSLYEEGKEYQKAREVYQKGLEYAPDDPFLLNNLAWVTLVHFQDQASAYLYLRKALDLAPDDAEIRDTLAWWYYLQEDYQQALSLLEEIVEAEPQNPLFRYHLGMVYLKTDA
ncbi:MAG: hypothetical protein D6736_20700, partial [Nitrospinota bacterium]